MEQLIEFAGNHTLLTMAWLAVATLLVVNLVQAGTSKAIPGQEAILLINREGGVAIDLRTASDFEAGHVVGAINVPAADLDQHLKKLEKYKDKPVVLYCAQGTSSTATAQRMAKLGFLRAQTLKGGLAAWKTENLPISRGKK